MSIASLFSHTATAMPVESMHYEVEVRAVSTVDDLASWGCSFNEKQATSLMFDTNTVMDGEPIGMMLHMTRCIVRADSTNGEAEPEPFGRLMLTQSSECNAMWSATIQSSDEAICTLEPVCVVADPWIFHTRGKLVAGIHEAPDGNTRWVVGLALEMEQAPATPEQAMDPAYSCTTVAFLPFASCEQFPFGEQDLEYLVAATRIDGIAQSASEAKSHQVTPAHCYAEYRRATKTAESDYRHAMELCGANHGFVPAFYNVAHVTGVCFATAATAGGAATACRKDLKTSVIAAAICGIGAGACGCWYGVGIALDAHSACIRLANSAKKHAEEIAEYEYEYCVTMSMLNAANEIPVDQ